MKNRLILTSVAVLLSACGTTSNGNVVSTATTTNASAKAMNTTADGTLDCSGLTLAMAETDVVIAENAQLAGGTQNGGEIATGVAVAGAQHVALQNGAAAGLSKVPFGGMLANMAMNKAANMKREKQEAAQLTIQSANLRKAKLAGIYAGKNCGA